MSVEIKKISFDGIEAAAQLLTENFVTDAGVVVLFKKNDPKYARKVKAWYRATLRMLMTNQQFISGAYIEDQLVGVSVVTHSTLQPSLVSILKWTWTILFSCHWSTVIKSAKHDQHRKTSLTDKNQYILEFIAVNTNYRGKGIGKCLFANLHDHAKATKASVWLETTKKHNIAIFKKMNYDLVGEKSELSVKYYVMTNENKEVI
ncbi:MAG: GNAT family N-acetyltransferase [Aureispira sp.]